ncbi:MAG: hypothetical protein KTR22_06120 [Flavobacteriaceae bacterium]|nr:hypothetical protein [Flavobacteriaceae bacterium]
MNSKWYLGTLFIVLAILGVGVKKTTTPNQEIIVQFDSEAITLTEAQGAIALVKEQLKHVGAENIRVSKSANGTLKITYFSKVDVASIQEILSHGEKLELGYTSYADSEGHSELPLEYDLHSYKLNVSEIQNSTEFTSDFKGYTLAFELKTSHRRYIDADFHFTFLEMDRYEIKRTENIAYQQYSLKALLVDNGSHNIPEVRAGPLT